MFDQFLNASASEIWQLAQKLDQNDALSAFRSSFYIPRRDGQPLVYLCGNSLGLQPKTARAAVEKEMEVWQNHGVEGWFESEQPWLSYHALCQEPLAKIVGAKPVEICPMNQLTVNLHLLLTSFYRPTTQRFKILTIAGDFPSDQYALETHLQARGFEPANSLIEVSPRLGERTIRTEDITAAIEANKDSLVLVCMSGLNYYTGQLYDLKTIAQTAYQAGVLVGFDLAHAIGNAPLQLHDWGVDFSTWCSYKYLNSGPGGVSGVFIHQKHHAANLPRLAGWWGYDETRRFEMTKGFVPMTGAAGWQLSTPTIVSLAIHHASLAIFEAAGMENLRKKSEELTAFLELIIRRANRERQWIEVITPENKAERGCQLSLLIEKEGKQTFDCLTQNGIIGDWREPNCIRLAPTPLYNNFEEIWKVGEVFLKAEAAHAAKTTSLS